jgi:hypothetical protein
MLNSASSIILTGDFNDDPDQESLLTILKARPDTIGLRADELVNLMYPISKKWNSGTIKYKAEWSVFDQFIVSGGLIKGLSGLQTKYSDAKIFRGGFLLDQDEKNLGVKLKRSYTGTRYTGGFSDHLPVYLDIRETGRQQGNQLHTP